jgi:hypothetical protein
MSIATDLTARLQAGQLRERQAALYAVEQVAHRCQAGERAALARQALRFIERGLPYYAPSHPDYQRWVQTVADFGARLDPSTAH